jgi:hypothetical protein
MVGGSEANIDREMAAPEDAGSGATYIGLFLGALPR